MNSVLNRVTKEQCGFITLADKQELLEKHSTLQVLVRTGANRFVCALSALDDVFEHVKSQGDYVRDVSLTAENHQRIVAGKPYLEWLGRTKQCHPYPA